MTRAPSVVCWHSLYCLERKRQCVYTHSQVYKHAWPFVLLALHIQFDYAHVTSLSLQAMQAMSSMVAVAPARSLSPCSTQLFQVNIPLLHSIHTHTHTHTHINTHTHIHTHTINNHVTMNNCLACYLLAAVAGSIIVIAIAIVITAFLIKGNS